jgi:hypothetical protein
MSISIQLSLLCFILVKYLPQVRYAIGFTIISLNHPSSVINDLQCFTKNV